MNDMNLHRIERKEKIMHLSVTNVLKGNYSINILAFQVCWRFLSFGE